jgi:uncharacterized membrane protein
MERKIPGDPDVADPVDRSDFAPPAHIPEETAETQGEREEAAVVVTEGHSAILPIVTEAARAQAAPDEEAAGVHIAPNLLELISGPTPTPEEKHEIEHTRELNEVVHRMLVIGLLASTAMMLAGVVLALVRHRSLTTTTPDFGSTWERIEALRPSGFLALGILILIATPIFRVLGAFVTFSYERDWRYAGLTLIVLLVLAASLLVGKG